MEKHEKKKYSLPVRIIMIVVLAALIAVLGYIISLEVRQINAERSGSAAVQAAEATLTPEEEEQKAEDEAAAEQARAEQEEQERLEREAAAKEAAQYSFYQKLSKGYDVKVLIMGDYVISGAGASSESKAWYSLLKDQLESEYFSDGKATVEITNRAASGNYALTDCLGLKQSEDEESFDLVVLCYGQNETEENFGLYFEALVRTVHEKYPDASVISVLEAAQGGYPNTMTAMQTVCKNYNIPVADTFKLCAADGIDAFMETLSSDSVSPSDKGHELYCQAIKEIIDENVTADTGKSESAEAFDSNAALFGTIVYVPADEMERTDDNTYSYSASNCKGMLMLYSSSEITRDNCKMIADDILYTLPKDGSVTDTDGNYLLTATSDLLLTQSMQLVFTDKDSADTLIGVYLIGESPETK